MSLFTPNPFLALGPQPQPGQPPPPIWQSMVPLVLLVVVFYFALIRPQQKKQKEHAALLKQVQAGDKIVTTSGDCRRRGDRERQNPDRPLGGCEIRDHQIRHRGNHRTQRRTQQILISALMNRNNLWRFILVVLVILWSLYELYPPKGRDLVLYFRDKAVDRDPTFTTIFTNALALQKAMPEKPYDNLVTAIGTNDITRYFPFFAAKKELHPKTYILNRLQREAAGRIRLGLDLQGRDLVPREHGHQQPGPGADASTAISHAVEVLRKRVDKFGVAEPLIQPQGSDRILIQLPGLSAADQESAKAAIQRAAFLEFRMVHPQSKELIEQGIVEPGYEILKRKEKTPDGQEVTESVMVKKRREMDGSGIKSAMVVRGNLGEPEINFTLDTKGAARFGEITTENVHQRMAIILDGELYSAPVINEPIMGGQRADHRLV